MHLVLLLLLLRRLHVVWRAPLRAGSRCCICRADHVLQRVRLRVQRHRPVGRRHVRPAALRWGAGRVSVRIGTLFALTEGAGLAVLQVRGQVEAAPVRLAVPAAGGARVAVAQGRGGAQRGGAQGCTQRAPAGGNRGVLRGGVLGGARARHRHARVHVLAREAVALPLEAPAGLALVLVTVLLIGVLARYRYGGCVHVLLGYKQ